MFITSLKRKIPNKNRNGDCFSAAGRYIMDMRFREPTGKCTLVHGIVAGQGAINGIRFLHAWVENENTVIDKSNGRDLSIPKDFYYVLGHINADETVRYTCEEASNKMMESGHYGPWDIEEPPIEGL